MSHSNDPNSETPNDAAAQTPENTNQGDYLIMRYNRVRGAQVVAQTANLDEALATLEQLVERVPGHEYTLRSPNGATIASAR